MENNTHHKLHQWYIQFDESPLELMHGGKCPPCVIEENREIWRRYKKIIMRHLNEEEMNTAEFCKMEQIVRDETSGNV